MNVICSRFIHKPPSQFNAVSRLLFVSHPCLKRLPISFSIFLFLSYQLLSRSHNSQKNLNFIYFFPFLFSFSCTLHILLIPRSFYLSDTCISLSLSYLSYSNCFYLLSIFFTIFLFIFLCHLSLIPSHLPWHKQYLSFKSSLFLTIPQIWTFFDILLSFPVTRTI
jgi:hypothetical protein